MKSGLGLFSVALLSGCVVYSEPGDVRYEENPVFVEDHHGNWERHRNRDGIFFDFEGMTSRDLNAIGIFGGQIFDRSVPGIAAAPNAGASGGFLSVGSFPGPRNELVAIEMPSKGFNHISFIWGSVDVQNTVIIHLNNGSTEVISGYELNNLRSFGSDSYRFEYEAPFGYIESVELTNERNPGVAFEIDNFRATKDGVGGGFYGNGGVRHGGGHDSRSDWNRNRGRDNNHTRKFSGEDNGGGLLRNLVDDVRKKSEVDKNKPVTGTGDKKDRTDRRPNDEPKKEPVLAVDPVTPAIIPPTPTEPQLVEPSGTVELTAPPSTIPVTLEPVAPINVTPVQEPVIQQPAAEPVKVEEVKKVEEPKKDETADPKKDEESKDGETEEDGASDDSTTKQ